MAESQWTRREFLEISLATGASVTAGATAFGSQETRGGMVRVIAS